MNMLRIFLELLSIPNFRKESLRPLRRSWSLVMYHPIREFFALVLEPVMFLTALCWGLGFWLKDIDGYSYSAYVLPGVVVSCAVFVPFWEVAFGAHARLQERKGYWVALQAPIEASDLALSEVIWGALKGLFASLVVLCFGALMGWVSSFWILIAPLLLVPACLLFAAFGLLCAVVFRSPSQLVLIQGLFLGPLTLWSDTFFPFSKSGVNAAQLMMLSPVFHIVNGLRMLTTEKIQSGLFLSLAILWLCASVLSNGSVLLFKRQLIPR